ncbi:MAG: hypothetical protein P1U86_04610 [Verrucomicrobiales bacterium]|nr:hypothetical protein [Verrucomicrobiales bacterium]
MKDEANEYELPENDRDLEALLKGLDPAALDVGVEADLLRDFERVASRIEPSGSAYDPNHIQWRRVIPLTAVCCAVMVVLGYMKIRERLPDDVVSVSSEPVPALTLSDESSSASVPGVPAGESVDRFLPVSAQGYLFESSSGGVISTPDGPREKMNVKYGDAYHWHDPETGTNIRFFQPRSEEIVVPLQTN